MGGCSRGGCGVWGVGVGVGRVGVGGVELEGSGSGGCTWFKITLKVLVPCSFLCCFQLPCTWFRSTL